MRQQAARHKSIAEAFAARPSAQAALIPWVMAGYPDLATSERLAIALGAAGADLIEIGVPFSDPLADGATIQRAGHAALEHGTTPGDALALASRVAARTAAPIIIMAYYNSLYAMGLAAFCARAARAGVAGLIVPDLPPEEAGPLLAQAHEHGLDLIFLVTPTSTDERLRRVAHVARGFVYCVSLTGVTGARSSLSAELPAFLRRMRAVTDLPLAVGFGISQPAHVAHVGQHAEGAVIASALVDAFDAAAPGEGIAAAVALLRSLRAASAEGDG
ncbi:MAG TPA: tryptophan synthase subunit alpha [Ktedonobacterales bacterium]